MPLSEYEGEKALLGTAFFLLVVDLLFAIAVL